MNHITRVELTSSGDSIPVGHYEFAAVTGQANGFSNGSSGLCFKLRNFSGNTVLGTLEIELMCNATMAKYRIPLVLNSSSVISSIGPCVFESTSDDTRCRVIKGRIPHELEGGVEIKVGAIALFPETYAWWQETSVKATFNARNVELEFLPNIPTTELDSKQVITYASSLPVLTPGQNFGTELPSPGVLGRIFFLEVQDE